VPVVRTRPAYEERPVSYHLFLDESVRKNYLVCAVVARPFELARSRTALRELCLPRQRRLHMEREQEPRRRFILDRIVRLGLRAEVYVCDDGDQVAARMGCLRQLVLDHAPHLQRLVIESSETMDPRDRRVIRETLLEIDGIGAFTYEHLRGFEEPLLWVADAVAWAYGAGGHWQQRVVELVDRRTEVKPVRAYR
jgi:hypothetical protein